MPRQCTQNCPIWMVECPHHGAPFPAHPERLMTDAPPTSSGESRTPVFRVGGRVEVDLDAPIARGTFCDVYRGWDSRSRRHVAAKTLRAEFRESQDQQVAFRREARLLAFLKHPNIVKVEAFVEEKGTFWAILEWLGGPSLQERMHDLPLRPEELVGPLEEVAEGLAHVHQRGLVHLDVQPENILADDDGTCKLIDLRRSLPSGTPVDPVPDDATLGIAYLAPEQLEGGIVTPQTDVYALGCIIYEALTGAPPMMSGERPLTVADLRVARRSTAPVDPTRLRPDLALPFWVDSILAHALAPNPSGRYGDIKTFARLFRSGVAGEFDVEDPDAPTLARDLPPLEHQPIDRQWIQTPKLPPQPVSSTGAGRASVPPAPSRQRFAGSAAPAAAVSRSAAPRPPFSIDAILPWLWRSIGVFVVLNLLVLLLLLFRGDGIPPFSGSREPALRGGGTAVVITQPLIVRSAPRADAPPLGELGINTRLVLGQPPVSDGVTIWWPVTLGQSGQIVTGYIPSTALAPVD